VLLSFLSLFLGLSHASKPSPTRPFVARAFQSPFPPNSSGSLSGVAVTAKDGLFYLNAASSSTKRIRDAASDSKKKETVFWVDIQGQAWLVCLILLLFPLDTFPLRTFHSAPFFISFSSPPPVVEQ